jgi:hypothetical protein
VCGHRPTTPFRAPGYNTRKPHYACTVMLTGQYIPPQMRNVPENYKSSLDCVQTGGYMPIIVRRQLVLTHTLYKWILHHTTRISYLAHPYLCHIANDSFCLGITNPAFMYRCLAGSAFGKACVTLPKCAQTGANVDEDLLSFSMSLFITNR